MNQITVNTATPYSILIGQSLLVQSGEEIKRIFPKSKAAIITDDQVASLYLKKVTASLTLAGIQHCVFVFPHGEQSKSHETLLDIYSFLAKNQLTRSDFLIALGGGVVGDITGYAAATYLRGIDFIQLPTTFLAQIDSSVGGKTGVNIKAGKNLIGAFHQPRLVLCDIDTLSTLSEEIYKDGISEAIKYGMIKDYSLFELLRSGKLKHNLQQVITRCIEIKRDVVEQDELDRGERMLLNFGHTVGHAIENYFNYTITHGKGVAIGMVVVLRAACAVGLCSTEIYHQLLESLEAYQIPTEADVDYSIACDACLTDKKRAGATINLILIRQIGEGYVYPIAAEKLKPFILKGLAQKI